MEDLDGDVTVLRGIWMQVLEIRRLAQQVVPDHELSRRLNAFADEIDCCARQIAEKIASAK
jgi:hypothetical protein